MSELYFKQKIQIPVIPNYMRLGEGQENSTHMTPTVHISQLSEEQLREIGRLWTEELVARAKKATKDE